MKKLLAFGDVHFPYHDPEALVVVRKVLRTIKPDIAVDVGDILDCKAFSTHAPDGEPDAPYDVELALANGLLDYVQKYSKQTVKIEGNHEYRIARYAARERAGKAIHNILSPQVNLSRGRKNFKYIPYENKNGRFAHYMVVPGLAAIHGWSYATNAARKHLELSQGVSIIYGHTHRSEHVQVQSVWGRQPLEAISCGCLCNLAPAYKNGQPNAWTHGFVLGYIGSRSHTLYFIPIHKGGCVLPDGKEIKI